MNFLGLGGFLEDTVGRAGMSLFRYIFFQIDKAIYELTIALYDIFFRLCNGKILSNSQISSLFGRISVILGMVMLFRVLFSFVQYLVDPDGGNNGKSMTNVIKRAVLVVVMLGISTWVFNLLTTVQTAVIQSNAISKILLPYDVDSASFGTTVSGTTFLTFFTIGDVGDNIFGASDANICDNNYYIKAKNKILTDGDYDMMSECVNEYAKVTFKGEDKERTTFVVDYNFLLATAIGVFLAYFIFSYTISVGVRMIQIAVLQILSPVAIIGYLSPKDENMFTKWSKVYISTYIDVFLRIIIINFAICVIGIIMEQGDSTFWKSIGSPKGILLTSYIKIIMMLAILQFAKKAPSLLSKILPAGDSGIGFGLERPGTTLAPLGTAIGVVGGAAVGAVTSASSRYRTNRVAGHGRIRSIIGGAIPGMILGGGRGGIAGSHKGNPIKNIGEGIGRNRQINNDYNDMILSGGSTLGKYRAKVGDIMGQSSGQRDERTINDYSSVSDTKSKLKELARSTDRYQDMERAADAYRNSAGATATGIQWWNDKLKKTETSIINAGLTGEFGDDWKNATANDENVISEMNNRTQDFNGFAKSRHLEMVDKKGNKIDEIKNADQLSASVDYANRKIGEIKSSDNYQRNKTNDRFAGNNSNKNVK